MSTINQPLISVIVPVYKTEPYLRRCVDSILDQTYRNLEIILVDDGSPDNCGAICDEYAEQDERVVVVHKENGGQGSARNAGLAIAKGQFVGFVDSDDWISTDMYQMLYDMCMDTNCDISQISIGFTSSKKAGFNDLYQMQTIEGKEIIYKFLYDGLYSRLETYSVCSKLYKRELFDELSFPDITHSEDYAVNSRLMQKCKRFTFSDKVCYFYNHLFGNTSTTVSKLNSNDFDILQTCDEVSILLQREAYRDINKLAKASRAMCDCGLLLKMALYGCDNTINNPEETVKQLVKNLRGNFVMLITAPMRLRRKVLVTGFCVSYNLVAMTAKIYRSAGG